MFDSRLSTAFTFTRCEAMKNKTSRAFCFLLYHILRTPWRSSGRLQIRVFQQNHCLKLLVKTGTPFSPTEHLCCPTAGGEGLELGFPHQHHFSPLVLFLISRQQACLRFSLRSPRPKSLLGISITLGGCETTKWKQGSQSLSPFSPWTIPTCTYYG